MSENVAWWIAHCPTACVTHYGATDGFSLPSSTLPLEWFEDEASWIARLAELGIIVEPEGSEEPAP